MVRNIRVFVHYKPRRGLRKKTNSRAYVAISGLGGPLPLLPAAVAGDTQADRPPGAVGGRS